MVILKNNICFYYNMRDNAIVLITRLPDNVWLNFLNNFKSYDIFICIDDTKKDYATIFENVNGNNITLIMSHKDYTNLILKTTQNPISMGNGFDCV